MLNVFRRYHWIDLYLFIRTKLSPISNKAKLFPFFHYLQSAITKIKVLVVKVQLAIGTETCKPLKALTIYSLVLFLNIFLF